jgi:hypothetical protein
MKVSKIVVYSHFTLVFLALSHFLQPLPDAHSVFGLSKCEKIQKLTIKTEQEIQDELDSWKVLINTSTDVQNASILKEGVDIWKNKVNELWKIGYNNPNCFTNSQKLFIKKLPKLEQSNFLTWSSLKIEYKNSNQCEKWKNSSKFAFKYIEKCTKSKWTLLKIKNWESIYTF